MYGGVIQYQLFLPLSTSTPTSQLFLRFIRSLYLALLITTATLVVDFAAAADRNEFIYRKFMNFQLY